MITVRTYSTRQQIYNVLMKDDETAASAAWIRAAHTSCSGNTGMYRPVSGFKWELPLSFITIASMDLLMNESLVIVEGPDVNTDGALLNLAVKLASLVHQPPAQEWGDDRFFL